MDSKSYADGVKDALEAISNLRISEAGNFEDLKCRGQRGADRSNALYDVYQIVKRLMPNDWQTQDCQRRYSYRL